jgi:hypothetical protein
MAQYHKPYSVNSIEDLTELRAAMHAPYLASYHAARVADQTQAVSVRLDNVRMLLWEISDLMDDASREHERVSFRELLESLRRTEVNLEAAVGKLARDLGLVAVI